MAQSRALGSAADLAGLGSGAGGSSPIVAQSSALGSATDLTGLGGVAVSSGPVVTQSSALGSATDLTGLGGVAVSSGPVVTQSRALGSATDLTGLGAIAVSIGPIVSAASSLDRHSGVGNGEGDVVQIGIEHIISQDIQGHSLAAGSSGIDGALEGHQDSVSSDVAGFIGNTNENQSGLSEAGFAEVHAALQSSVYAGAASHEGQALGDVQRKHDAAHIGHGSDAHLEGDGITGVSGGSISLDSEIDAGRGRGRNGSTAANGNGVNALSVGDVVQLAVEHIVVQDQHADGQVATGALIDGALEGHQDRVGRDVAGFVGNTNENLGGLSKAGFTEVQAALQVGVHIGTAGYEGQTLGNSQFKDQTTQVFHRVNSDGVGDGITHICLGLVRFYRKSDDRLCRYRYCNCHQAYEQDKTQDD